MPGLPEADADEEGTSVASDMDESEEAEKRRAVLETTDLASVDPRNCRTSTMRVSP